MLPTESVSELRSVDLQGHERWLQTFPGQYVLHDCRDDGAVLLERMNTSAEIAAVLPGSGDVVDLSWLNDSTVADVSPDGRQILFLEGTAPRYSAYLRGTQAGASAVRLGDGLPTGLSPDG